MRKREKGVVLKILWCEKKTKDLQVSEHNRERKPRRRVQQEKEDSKRFKGELGTKEVAIFLKNGEN